MIHSPLTIGLLLCDLVIVDDKTRRFTPVNCFGRREVTKRFPVEIDFYIVAGLTNGQGTGLAKVVIEQLDTMDEVFKQAFTVNFPSPLREHWFVIPVRNCCFPSPAMYEATLILDGNVIALRRFEILKKEAAL